MSNSNDSLLVFITQANLKKIVFNSDIMSVNLTGEIYKIPIRFFSRYEKNSLLAIQELLKDPEKYFKEIYVPYKPVDTYKFIYEGQLPAYHKYTCCPNLQSDFQNFEIPFEIRARGQDAVKEFRLWFESVKYLLEKSDSDAFVARLLARWGILTNPGAINWGNSGWTLWENLTIEEMENRIDGLIKEAGRFYYGSEKNKKILDKYARRTSLAQKPETIPDNDTGYGDEELREFLKQYDEQFKKPTKRYLIDYYRLKFNPEIRIEGRFLEKLGFKPCSNCHSDNFVPSESQKNLETRSQKKPDERDIPF
jgi:hypothetical protein